MPKKSCRFGGGAHPDPCSALGLIAPRRRKPCRTELVTSVVPGTRCNNFSGWIGTIITVGERPLTVTSLGRMFYEGNTAAHPLKLVDAETREDVQGAAVTVQGGTVGKFTYSALETPVTLEAGKQYYLMSEEVADGRQPMPRGITPSSPPQAPYAAAMCIIWRRTATMRTRCPIRALSA